MTTKTALIVVDMQNDFCPPDGSLAVSGARDLVPLINSLLSSPNFAIKVATQDYHPKDHISFASNHAEPNNKPFESFIDMKNLVAGRPEETMKQRLWPVHCVQHTKGAELIEELDKDKIDLTVQKGMDSRVEMYSAFSDSFGNLTKGSGGVSHDLAQVFQQQGITDVYVVGVAGDYCVKSTALDSAKAGFTTFVYEEGTKCVDPATWTEVNQEFAQGSVKLINVQSPESMKVLKT